MIAAIVPPKIGVVSNRLKTWNLGQMEAIEKVASRTVLTRLFNLL